MKDANEEAKRFFEGLDREELKEMLIEAGFEVEDGTGQVIFTNDERLKTDIERLKKIGGEDTSELIANFRHGVEDKRIIDCLAETPNLIKDIQNLQRKIRELKELIVKRTI